MQHNSETLKTISMAVVVLLVLMTALGNAVVMFWVSVIGMIGMLLWFSTERNGWLASLTGVLVAVAIALHLAS